MRRWQREPDSFRILALFRGDHPHLKAFLQAWVLWGGPLALPAVRIGSQGALAILVEHIPAYALIGWWLDRPPHWQLFYQPRREGEEDGAGSAAGSVLHGAYFSWGYEDDSPAGEGERPVLRRVEGGELDLTAVGPFHDLFEWVDRGPLFFVPPDGTTQAVSASASGRSGPPFTLRLRLSEIPKQRRSPNTDLELSRLRKRIVALRDQAEALEAWRGDEPVVEMRVYPETAEPLSEGGTLWDLRAWFATAPPEHIAELLHVRVEITDLPPLHLLLPARPGQDLQGQPPYPAHLLRLDPHWQRLGRSLYLPEKWELLPPPPPYNEHVRGLMEGALWEDADRSDVLVLLRMPGGRLYRFVVSGFAPLAGRVAELNFQVAIARVVPVRHDISRGAAALLAQMRHELEGRLEEHAREIGARLDAFWSGERADLERYRADVAKAAATAVQIRSLREKVEAIRRSEEDRWSTFCREVLRLDRERFSSDDLGLRGTEALLAELDDLRADVAAEAVRGDPEQLQRLATRLHSLADRLAERNRP